MAKIFFLLAYFGVYLLPLNASTASPINQQAGEIKEEVRAIYFDSLSGEELAKKAIITKYPLAHPQIDGLRYEWVGGGFIVFVERLRGINNSLTMETHGPFKLRCREIFPPIDDRPPDR